jgi:hypothetical protein
MPQPNIVKMCIYFVPAAVSLKETTHSSFIAASTDTVRSLPSSAAALISAPSSPSGRRRSSLVSPLGSSRETKLSSVTAKSYREYEHELEASMSEVQK